ncbi:MAG: AMP-binding protein [Bacteroidales bacterium]|nr:AMP-binding protein [Bacteroidales bacterium]
MLTFDWFEKWATYHPFKIAFKEFETDREYSYSQFNKMGNCFAAHLRDNHGFAKGDRLAVISDNNMEYIVLFSVAQKLGITLVPLNYRLTPAELDFIVANADVKGIIYEKKYFDKIKHLDSFNGIAFKLTIEELVKFNETCLNQKNTVYHISTTLHEDDPIFILYTSGTTAFPKGALYTHKMLFWNSINTEMRLDITSNDISINCAPPFHTGGWNVLLTPFIHHGAYTILMRGFDAELLLEVLEMERVTIWWAVPTMLRMMAESPVFQKVKLNRLRYLIVGGESLPIPVIELWHRKGVLIRQGYGLTEVGPNVTSLDQKDAMTKKGSIGTMNFYYQAKLVSENDEEVQANEPGQLILKGPTVTPGYWKNAEATAESLRDGWFYTGDIMKKDAEGYYYVLDRIKNMYISGGENVYPAEVEHMLRQHPAISEVAIIGVSDERWGETGKAFVVLRSGETLTNDELNTYCLERVAKYKIPKYFTFVQDLPKNDAGKIDRKKLPEIH